MCGVAEKVGAWFWPTCPGFLEDNLSRSGLPWLMPFISFFKLNVYFFFRFPTSLLTFGSDVLANPWGMHIVAGHGLLLLS